MRYEICGILMQTYICGFVVGPFENISKKFTILIFWKLGENNILKSQFLRGH